MDCHGHERFEGTGYTDVEVDTLSEGVRILALADAVEAVLSHCPLALKRIWGLFAAVVPEAFSTPVIDLAVFLLLFS